LGWLPLHFVVARSGSSEIGKFPLGRWLTHWRSSSGGPGEGIDSRRLSARARRRSFGPLVTRMEALA